MKKKIIITILSILILFIVVNTFIYQVIDIDTLFYNSFVKIIINKNNTKIFKGITELGSATALISICILLIIIFFKKKKTKYIPLNLIIAFLFNLLLKIIFRRSRPIDINLITEKNYSFPSGHAMISTAFYGLLIYFIYKYVNNKLIKITLITALVVLILLISYSRVYLGVHYLSDVLSGITISVLYLFAFIKLIGRFDNEK